MRVTKQMLEVRLGAINRRLGEDYWLNNAPHYGGWQLTANRGRVIVKGRLPPKQMLSYLEGMLTGLDMKEGAYR